MSHPFHLAFCVCLGAKCKAGYSEWSGKCVKCTETHWDYVFLLLFISFACESRAMSLAVGD